MKEKFCAFLGFLLVLIFLSPLKVDAMLATMDGKCKVKKEQLECAITLHSNREQVVGVRYHYKKKYPIRSFQENEIWNLKESRDDGVLLVTRNLPQIGSIPIGTIVVEKSIGNEILVEDLEISYPCGEKYCDEIMDSLKINLNVENKDTLTSISSNTTWIWIIGLVVVLLFLIILVKRRKRKEKASTL